MPMGPSKQRTLSIRASAVITLVALTGVSLCAYTSYLQNLAARQQRLPDSINNNDIRRRSQAAAAAAADAAVLNDPRCQLNNNINNNGLSFEFIPLRLTSDSSSHPNDNNSSDDGLSPLASAGNESTKRHNDQQTRNLTFSWLRLKAVLTASGNATSEEGDYREVSAVNATATPQVSEQNKKRNTPTAPTPSQLTDLPPSALVQHTASLITIKVRGLLSQSLKEEEELFDQFVNNFSSQSSSVVATTGAIPRRFLHVYKSVDLPTPAVEILTQWQRRYPKIPHITLDDDDCRGLAALFDYAVLEEQRVIAAQSMAGTTNASNKAGIQPSTPVQYPYRMTLTEAFDKAPVGVMRGDLGRLLAVFFIGGLYTDLDVMYRLPFSMWSGGRPWESLWVPSPVNATRPRDILLGYEYETHDADYCNWMLGARPRHPVFWFILHSAIRTVSCGPASDPFRVRNNTSFIHQFAGPNRFKLGIDEYNSIVRHAASRRMLLHDGGEETTSLFHLANVTTNTYRTPQQQLYNRFVVRLLLPASATTSKNRSNDKNNSSHDHDPYAAPYYYDHIVDNTLTQAVPSMNNSEIKLINVFHVYGSQYWQKRHGYSPWTDDSYSLATGGKTIERVVPTKRKRRAWWRHHRRGRNRQYRDGTGIDEGGTQGTD